MKSSVCGNETLHLLRIEIGLTCGLEFIHQQQDAVRQLRKSLDIFIRKLLASDLRNYVDFQRLAQFVEVHNVLAR